MSVAEIDLEATDVWTGPPLKHIAMRWNPSVGYCGKPRDPLRPTFTLDEVSMREVCLVCWEMSRRDYGDAA